MRGVSFSEKVKEELAALNIPDGEELEAELLGFIKGKGSFNIPSGGIRLSLSSLAAARRFVEIVKKIAGSGSKYLSVSTRNLDKKKRVEIEISKDVVKSWRDIMDNEKIFSGFGKDPVILGTFIRGLFLASGSMTDPRKHYHLEIVTFDVDMLKRLSALVEEVFGIPGKVVKLRYSNRLYYKRSSSILELLHIMGALKSAAAVERVIREKEAKGDTNRSFNFITANAMRSAASIVKQIEAIRKIEKRLGMNSLPEDLRRVAQARLENEELSLRELGEILNMSKMKVYTRLKKLLKIAEGLK